MKKMDEEALFDMVNEAVMYAKEKIEKEEGLDPFAMILQDDGMITSLDEVKESDHDRAYEKLIEVLRERTGRKADIAAFAIVTRVTIPAEYKASTQTGIRVHLEEQHKQGDKVGARFLYIPYQLYRNSQTGKVTMQLQTPIPVSFPPEVFV
jgi:hypothetical protein